MKVPGPSKRHTEIGIQRVSTPESSSTTFDFNMIQPTDNTRSFVSVEANSKREGYLGSRVIRITHGSKRLIELGEPFLDGGSMQEPWDSFRSIPSAQQSTCNGSICIRIIPNAYNINDNILQASLVKNRCYSKGQTLKHITSASSSESTRWSLSSHPGNVQFFSKLYRFIDNALLTFKLLCNGKARLDSFLCRDLVDELGNNSVVSRTRYGASFVVMGDVADALTLLYQAVGVWLEQAGWNATHETSISSSSLAASSAVRIPCGLVFV
ncbi:hypothetical protein HG531_001163 [Fusarium graminearum]|nr:hypothetical protein HG531_001163 [Fusarium graminearum]